MAGLQKRVVPIQFQGLNTKSDPKTAPLGTYAAIENRNMNQFAKMEQRAGLKLLGSEFVFPDMITGGYYVNKEAGVFTQKELYSYSTSEDTYVSKGTILAPIMTSTPALSNTYTQSVPTCDIAEDGRLGVVWEDSRGGVWFMVRDTITGAVVTPETLIDANAFAPKIVTYGNFFYVTYLKVDLGFPKLYIYTYNYKTDTVAYNAQLVSGQALYGDGIYDIIEYNGNLLVVYPITDPSSPGGWGLYALFWDTSSNTIGSTLNGLPDPSQLTYDYTIATVSTYVPRAISLCSILDECFMVSISMVCLNGLSLHTLYARSDTFNSNFTPRSDQSLSTAYTAVFTCDPDNDSDLSDNPIQMSSIYAPEFPMDEVLGSGSPQPLVQAFVSFNPGGSDSADILDIDDHSPLDGTLATYQVYNPLDLEIHVLQAQYYLYHMTLVSKPFLVDDRIFVICDYEDPFQDTYFLVRDDFHIVSRIYTKAGGGPLTRDSCPTKVPYISLTNIDDSDVQTASIACLLRKTAQISTTTTSYSKTSIYSEQFYFTNFEPISVGVDTNLYISGGYLKTYDSYPGIVELGFHLYPKVYKTITEVVTSGSGVTPGNYNYKVIFTWFDNSGNLYRSETSVPTSLTLSNSDPKYKVTLCIQTLSATLKCPIPNIWDPDIEQDDNRSNVTISVYRTVNNGTTYYLLNPDPATSLYNDRYTGKVVYEDTTPDTSITSNPLLYTTGGVVENTALPTTNLVALAKNRLFVCRPDIDSNRYFFSKEKEIGVGFEFSEDFVGYIDPFGGPPTSIMAMDDKVLIFKETAIYYIYGPGPDKVGNGGFSTPELISTDCGSVNPYSVVLTGDGVMFKSAKGIYIVTRQLSVDYIGDKVEAYNDLTITSASNLSSENMVFFTTKEGTTLVYNTYFKDWKTYTHQPSRGGFVLASRWFMTNTTFNLLCVADNSKTTDYNGQPIVGRFFTNWLSLAGVEGFQRIYTVRILGDGQSYEHRLNVRLYFDYENYVSERYSIVPSSQLGPAYGVDSPYGSGTPYGSSNPGTYRYDIKPKRQKCTAIRVEIFDSFPTGNRTQSFSLSDIVLEVGLKQGMSTLTYTRRLT